MLTLFQSRLGAAANTAQSSYIQASDAAEAAPRELDIRAGDLERLRRASPGLCFVHHFLHDGSASFDFTYHSDVPRTVARLCRLSVSSILSTWLVALRREGQPVSAWNFLRLGCLGHRWAVWCAPLRF
jgi:hypothetical protein